jgi:hypothetical protein
LFPDADKTTALTKLNEVKTLMPFLLSLTVEERKKLRKMGPKSVAYVQQCLAGAIAFPNELKRNFDTPEFQKDVNLIANLLGVQVICQALLELIEDTMMAAGVDAMNASDEVYESLKSSAKSNANVKSMVDTIALRFKEQGKKAPKIV